MVPPEMGRSSIPIMQEAAELTPLLLVIEENVQALNAANTREQVAQLRLARGYPSPQVVDMSRLVDTRVTKETMLSPATVEEMLPLSPRSVETTLTARDSLSKIHSHLDPRLAVALGECSVFNPESTIEYTHRILDWQKKFPNLLLMQRTFFEKPRTWKPKGKEASWKGFMLDPRMDGSDDINLGVVAARMIVCRVTDLGVPAIKEQLNALTPQYLDGLITQDNIGARNISDQKAMEYLSGTSAVGGAKNALDGNIETAMQAVAAAHRPHSFLGIDKYGKLCVVRTQGNQTSHVVLRGGTKGTNFDAESIADAKALAIKYGLELSLDVDLSHGNSLKDHNKQIIAGKNVAGQIADGEDAVTGVQMESNHKPDNQPFKLGVNIDDLDPEVSITDKCLGPDDTEELLYGFDESAAKRQEGNRRQVHSARTN